MSQMEDAMIVDILDGNARLFVLADANECVWALMLCDCNSNPVAAFFLLVLVVKGFEVAHHLPSNIVFCPL